MKIAFFGTPDFSVPVLKTLISSGHEVVLAVSQPDRPRGRSLTTEPTPVKKAALEAGLNVLQPEKCSDPAFLAGYKKYSPDINIIVAFGQLFPAELINHPEYKTINIHASLLPKYRGASPINWAVINGDAFTGVTYQFIEQRLDAGDIIYQEKMPIAPEDDSITLFGKLSLLSAASVLKVLDMIASGNVIRVKQDESKACTVKTLKKEEGKIDFNAPAVSIVNRVRGLLPWPVAYCLFRGKKIKIYSAETASCGMEGRPGEIIDAVKNKGILAKTGDGCVLIKTVQPESGKKMNAWDFSLGHKDIKGEILL
jgi:methionyl-tRNA formyltransferase